MDEFPENDEQTQDASDREASEAAERELTDEAMPTRGEDEAPPAGEGGMPEEQDVLPSEQAQEASLTGVEEATEQQREAVVAEMAEQAAEATDEDAAQAAEEAAVQTVEEPEEPAEPAEHPTEEAPAPDQEVAAPEPAAEAPSDAFSGPGDWYVIHTYAGYENKVKTNLESRIQTMQMQDKIFSVYIPMEDVMEIKGGRKQVVQKKVFPGYLLVRMEYDDDSWYVVRNTPGVTGFVAAGTGQKPTPLPRHEVEKFLAPQKEEAKPQFRLEFEEGDVVRIIAGPFADFNGTISEINVDQSKVKVMVNIFDRETPVELSFDQVARV
ncbi:MAG TPA: transcription termination/antitermination protein NusG [Actinomycetota bacterium]